MCSFLLRTYMVVRSTSKTGASPVLDPLPTRSLALLAKDYVARRVCAHVFMPAGIANMVPYRVGCRLLLCCALTNYSGTSYREVIVPAI